MNFEIRQEGEVSILTLISARLDSKLAPELKSRFILLANEKDTVHLVVDLEKVDFADSSGLGALLLAQRLYRESEGKLILVSVSARVMKLLEISRLTKVFNIAKNLDEAFEILNLQERR